MTLSARLKITACAIGAALLGVVIVQNTETVETRVLFTTVTMPRAALLFICGLVGFCIGLVTALSLRRGDRSSSA